MRGTAEREYVTPLYRTPIAFFLLLSLGGYHIDRSRPLALLFFGLSSAFFLLC